MICRKPVIFIALGLLTAATIATAGRAIADTPPEHLLPQSIQIQHKEALEALTELAAKPGAVGVEAGKVLALMKTHMAKEQEFILTPLTLLPDIADGKVTPDMAWALPLIDKVKENREALFQEHVAITEALNELVVTATAANDQDAKEFAEEAAADSLTDLEIFEPTLLLIGDALRAKLPAAH